MLMGPGFRGERHEADDTQRRTLAQAIVAAGENPPIWLSELCAWVDREAKLFEAGDYPDKGVTITADCLIQLAGRFSHPVPVLIEHADAPLEMGWLTSVEARGGELFGTVSLTHEANQLVNKSRAFSLSLGLSKDLGEIREVSLVRRPRIASARLFASEGLFFWGGLDEASTWKARCAELEAQIAGREADEALETLMTQGRLTPAQAPIFRALTRASQTIEFDGESMPVAALVQKLVELAPRHSLFAELAPGATLSNPHLSADQADFYAKRFPDLSLDEIAKLVARAAA